MPQYTKCDYNKEYRQKSKGQLNIWLTKTYSRMKRDNKNKFQKPLSFSKDEFRNWIIENYNDKILYMLQEYKDSGFNKYMNPSIDRIDDYTEYIFSNMQLITWAENDLKGSNGRKNKESCAEVGRNYCSKSVIQYDESMNFVAEYYSTHDAGRQTGYDSSLIARACRLHRKAKGFYWRYKNEKVINN